MLGGMNAIEKNVNRGGGSGEGNDNAGEQTLILKVRVICIRESELLVRGQMQETEIMGNDKVINFCKCI